MHSPHHARADDAFPTTQGTWLGTRIHEGGPALSDANRHVMTVYAHPLKVYLLGSTFRWLGEPEDIVQGFFADRLGRSDFLQRWLDSRRPLRFWLIVGFKHYLLEECRRRKRDAGQAELSTESASGSAGEEPDRVFDRACAQSIVTEAFERARLACEAGGLSAHWRLFLRHHLEDRSYADLSGEFGVDEARAAVMARTAASKFKAALRELVAWDGATADQIDQEIGLLLEVTGS